MPPIKPFSMSKFPFNAAHSQARLDASAPVSSEAVAQAVVENVRQSRDTGAKLYRDTPNRAQWRALFDAAVSLPDVVMAVTFLTDGQEPRVMLCQPHEVNSDHTKRYTTVWDIEAGGYRRVNLDAIVKLNLETHSMPQQF